MKWFRCKNDFNKPFFNFDSNWSFSFCQADKLLSPKTISQILDGNAFALFYQCPPWIWQEIIVGASLPAPPPGEISRNQIKLSFVRHFCFLSIDTVGASLHESYESIPLDAIFLMPRMTWPTISEIATEALHECPSPRPGKVQ
jgi:hypothetical protein